MSLISFVLASLSLFGPQHTSLPAEWSAEFVVEFSLTGSMDGSYTQGRITYDSCILNLQRGQNAPIQGFYKMTEPDRTAIIKKLHELKADQIKGTVATVPVNDGWSEVIRMGDIWISSGPSTQMTDEDRARFHEVFEYLEVFAIKVTNAK